MNLRVSRGVSVGFGNSEAARIPTIVFIETYFSGSSRDAIRAAARLGYFTVVLTKRGPDAIKGFSEVNRMIHVDSFEFSELNEHIMVLIQQGKEIKTIVSFIEQYVYLATLLATAYGINHLSSEALKKMANKILTREALANTPYNPYYAVIYNREQLPDFIENHRDKGILIVKLPDSHGSRHVILAENEVQLERIALNLFSKFPGQTILVEKFIPGQQFLVEVLVYEGQVNIVAIIEQEVTFENRFIVTGYSLLTKCPESLYRAIERTVISILNSLGMTMGGCHLELKVLNDDWKLVEANPRISGGAMNRMIKLASGVDLAEQTLRVALGEPPCLEKSSQEFVFTQYLTVDSSGILELVTGRNRASRYPGVADVFIKYRRGSLLRPPESMGQRCGYLMATGDTPQQAQQRAKDAAKEIRFHLKNSQEEGAN